jgi:hypothetical protein
MTNIVPQYDQGSTGAVNRPINQKLAESVSVKDFGAKGDGTTDDTNAIQNALNSSTLGTIFFPSGTYIISSPINVPVSVSIVGESAVGTIIKMANGANIAAILQTKNFATLTGTTSTGGTFRSYIGGITIDGNKANNTAGVGIRLYGKGYTLQNIAIANCYSTGLYTEYAGTDDFSSINGTLEAYFNNLTIQQNNDTGWIFKGAHDSIASCVVIFNNGGWGLDIKRPLNCTLINIYLNTSGGIWVNGSGTISGSNVIASTGSGYGMLIDTGTGGCNLSSSNFGGAGVGLAALQINSPNHIIHGIVANTGPSFGGDATSAAVKFGASGSAKLDLNMFNNLGYWFDVSSGGGATSYVAVHSYSVAGTLFNGTPSQVGTWFVNGQNTAHQYMQFTTFALKVNGWSINFPAANGTITVA